MSDQPLSIISFGNQLLATQDLDPVYVGVVGLKMDPDALARWLLAYWCFYHVGVACWMSELDDSPWAHPNAYWEQMLRAAANTEPSPLGGRWPRAPERRHFRGEKCVQAIRYHMKTPASWLIKYLVESDGEANQLPARLIMKRAQGFPLFGPWIAFKIADMLERCAGYPVMFSDDLGLVYSEPRAALDLLGEPIQTRSLGDVDYDWKEMSAGGRWYTLLEHWRKYEAPPRMAGYPRRPVGPQEVETICCKWKSHYNGHYWVGKDTKEIYHALEGWGARAETMMEVLRWNGLV